MKRAQRQPTIAESSISVSGWQEGCHIAKRVRLGNHNGRERYDRAVRITDRASDDGERHSQVNGHQIAVGDEASGLLGKDRGIQNGSGAHLKALRPGADAIELVEAIASVPPSAS